MKKYIFETRHKLLPKYSTMIHQKFSNFKKNLLFLFVIAGFLFFNGNDVFAQQNYKVRVVGYVPKDGFVPNKLTAIRIAISVWLPIYGDNIYNEKPFVAVLKDGIWKVNGSLPKKFTIGGVAEIWIQKKDGKILRVIHGK